MSVGPVLTIGILVALAPVLTDLDGHGGARAVLGEPEPPSATHSKRVNIGFSGSIPSGIDQRVSSEGGHILRVVPQINLVVAEVNQGVSQDDFLGAMLNYNDTHYAVPDVILIPHYMPNDRYYNSTQKHYLVPIGAEEAWDVEKGESATKIAIIDTGVFCTHEDLSVPQPGRTNSICDPLSPAQFDANGHGTFIAGAAAAIINNDKGIAGISQSTIYSASLSDPFNMLLLGEAAAAIVAASQVPDVRMISMSWSTTPLNIEVPCSDPILGNVCLPLKAAIDFAHYVQGKLLIASAGNDNSGNNEDCAVKTLYPAAWPEVMAIGAYDHVQDTWAKWSACARNVSGGEIDLIAPGTTIWSTVPQSNFVCLPGTQEDYYCASSGTSFAVPFVDGAAALMWSKCGEAPLSRDDVWNLIVTTAEPLPDIPAEKQGNGLLKLDAALAGVSC